VSYFNKLIEAEHRKRCAIRAAQLEIPEVAEAVLLYEQAAKAKGMLFENERVPDAALAQAAEDAKAEALQVLSAASGYPVSPTVMQGGDA